MSAESWKLDKDLCRCCHSEGVFKNLAEPHSNENQVEIYCDMMQQCLDITINPVEGPLYGVTYTICQECIQRLRDACSFKRQVTLCEQRFYELYNRNGIKSTPVCDVEVKIEISDSDHDDMMQGIPLIDENDDDRLDANYENGDTDNKDENDAEIKPEEEEEAKKARPKKARPKKGRPKAKVKQRRQVKKVGRPRKTAAPAPVDVKDVKGGKTRSAPKFRLQEDDFNLVAGTYYCAKCDKRYHNVCSLRFHVKSKHYKIPRHPCPYCEEEFNTPAPLTLHKLKEHHVDDRLNCNACKGVFNSRVQLRKHINNFHMLGEKYKCQLCEYESFSFEGMYKHKFKHKTVKDYQCRFCRKAFVRKTTLDLHERIHTGDRRKVCSICSKAFVQKASLNYHMTKYHPEVNF